MANVCVRGGSGFIGTRLCKRFETQGRGFFIVDKRESWTFPEKTRIADVRDKEALSKVVEGDIIINLAAEHRDDVAPRSVYKNNGEQSKYKELRRRKHQNPQIIQISNKHHFLG